MELERPFKVYKKIPDKRHDFYSEIMKINFMLSQLRCRVRLLLVESLKSSFSQNRLKAFLILHVLVLTHY